MTAPPPPRAPSPGAWPRRRRLLPCGPRDLLLQCAIWFGFLLSYQVVRGAIDHDRSVALTNGRQIVELEEHLRRPLVELTLQRLADSSHAVRTATAWTYWNSEFTIVLLALAWVYLRRHDHFIRLRNALLLANVLALAGFALHPTAPPRMFPRFGFHDTLDSVSGVHHGSGLVQLASNPYAAMPSLHSADALIVAVVLAATCQRVWSRLLWLLWPAWVWFCVMATANHFLLDVVAGFALGAAALTAVAIPARFRILVADG